MASPKEKCFRKALDKINEGREAKGERPLDVANEQGWIRDAEKGWQPAPWYRELWYSIRKTMRIQNGLQDPRPPGAANPEQFRKPDLTLTREDGSKAVIDTKFTDADGKPDGWRTEEGMGGKTQQEDYQDINRQQGNDIGEPKLDKDNCDCGKRKLETETVEVRVPALQPGNSLFFAPLPAPGGVPMPAPAPTPGGFAVPEFVFP
ncbi:MAG TPA: hypothetical protein VMG32_03580 [Anaeromyxobacteraceae bacterium]|nr:hypothetical protein [Anaeromyxobacteraceae bacterium]